MLNADEVKIARTESTNLSGARSGWLISKLRAHRGGSAPDEHAVSRS